MAALLALVVYRSSVILDVRVLDVKDIDFFVYLIIYIIYLIYIILKLADN